MANIRKLSAFRQLSLNCESPTTDKRRKSLKKQFSEDFCEVKGAKTRDRPPHPIKIAWAETDPESPKEEGVIAKKCIKVKKTPKLTKHSSLEKESILYSKQELAERLRQALKEREQEKPNLNIFLAHNTNSNEDEGYNEEPEVAAKELPKITPPLLTPMENTMKNVFQIRKSKEIAYPPPKSSAVVVIPIVEKEDFSSRQGEEAPTPPSSERKEQDPKAIKNVIIRPATAAAKRERFQKRTSTAFNSVVKDATRPPLVRSSSAPAKPEKPKFLATKRKIKSGKRSGKLSEDEDGVGNKENPKNQKEMNRYVPVNGNEIVTMVSLISPAASDNEEAEEKPKAKSPPVKKEEAKNLSLRKTVKSVTFQQSSIHAIRSFSASFPARRGSMATALMLGNGLKSQKNQEKRATNSTALDDDERGPKRRLVRSATGKMQKSAEDDAAGLHDAPKINDEEEESENNITVDIKTKTVEETEEEKLPEAANSTTATTPVDGSDAAEKPETDEGEPQFGSVKEKQCWDMYCKMADKGLKVSYDTILRGMLTPTEYRMRRKESIVNVAEDVTNAH